MHGRTHRAGSSLPGVGAQFGALADGRQLLQMVAVGGGEPQRLSQRGEDLSGGAGVAALFQADQVLHADPGQGGQLCSAKPWGLPPGTGWEADVGGTHGFAAAAEKISQLVRHHADQYARPPFENGWP